MSIKIDPARLSKLRKDQRLTLDALADKSRIARETIHRIEKGRPLRTRASTLTKLSAALGVQEEVLTGQVPMPSVPRSDNELAREQKSQLTSQFNVEIGRAEHNAYVLVAQRYGIPMTRVAELAPFLFVLVAEQSLRWRKSLLDQFSGLLDQQHAMLTSFPHLNTSIAMRDDAADVLQAEEHSIAAKDILASQLPERIYDDFSRLKWRYDETADNPFVRYLTHIASDHSDVLDLAYFSADDMTMYTVCKDDLQRLTGGDRTLADAVRFGLIQLSAMPRHLNDEARKEDRIAWMRSELDAHQRSLPDAASLLALL